MTACSSSANESVQKREAVGGVRAGQRADIAPVELQKAVLVRVDTLVKMMAFTHGFCLQYLSTLLEEKRLEIGVAMNVLPKGTSLNSTGP